MTISNLVGSIVMKDNKVVIKLNYPHQRAETKAPQLVTVWHVKRIVIAAILLLLTIAVLFYFFIGMEPAAVAPKQNNLSENTGVEKKDPVIVKPLEPVKVKEVDKVIDPIPKVIRKEVTAPEVVVNENNISTKNTLVETESKPKTQSGILDKRISRALLAKDIVNKEPVGKINAKVAVVKEKATGVFFFTEINDMKGETLYHEWLRNDELVFKRKINILNTPWRAATSKLITYSRKGSWQVRLVDKNGKVLSLINFEAI